MIYTGIYKATSLLWTLRILVVYKTQHKRPVEIRFLYVRLLECCWWETVVSGRNCGWMCAKKAPIGNKINTILQFCHHKLNIGTQYFFFITTQLGVNKRKYRSGLAGEINRPQVLLYPLIESSNIPRYNWYKNIDKVILCVAIHVLVKQYHVSCTVLTLVPGHLNFTKANGKHGKIDGKYVQL